MKKKKKKRDEFRSNKTDSYEETSILKVNLQEFYRIKRYFTFYFEMVEEGGGGGKWRGGKGREGEGEI